MLRACAMDPRAGAKYRFHMRGPDGDGHWPRGIFREIAQPQRLVLTWYWSNASGNQMSPETPLTVPLDEDGKRGN
jgi:uncharacterized protein YndB with AHSA1/START domain